MKLYSIGQASAMIGIPIKTLRYYESVGLCTPSLVDEESAYRYYSIDDIFRLDLIRCLGRQLGMPLKTIREFLEESASPQTMKTYLSEQSAQLAAQIQELQLRQEFIDKKLAAIERREKAPVYQVYVEKLCRRELSVRSETVDTMQDAMLMTRKMAVQNDDDNWPDVYILQEDWSGERSTLNRQSVTIGFEGRSSLDGLSSVFLEEGTYYSIEYPYRDGAREAAISLLLRQMSADGVHAVGPVVNSGSLIDSSSALSRDYVIKTQLRVMADE